MNSELLKEINAAPRVALGSLLETVDVRGGTVDHNEIEGVNINKTFVPTVANLKNTDLSKYKHVPTFAFATNLMHIGRDVIFPVALNTSRETKFVSPAYFVFRIKDGCKLLPLFLLTLFRTSSFDRRVWFATDSSIRGNLTWDDMCRVKIPLPPIEVQRAYVDAYKGLTALIEENEALLKSLEVTAQACVAECREKWPMVLVGDYVQPFIRKNSDDLDLPFMGVNREKQIVPTSANTEIIDRRKYSVLKRGEFVFSGMQTGRDVCIRIALSEMLTDILLSPAYMTFRIDSTKPLLPEYFFMNFKVAEMDRQGWFKSDSSVRSNLDWDRFCEIEIPLPPIEVQRAYVDAYKGLTALIEENEALLKSLEVTAQACVAECREKWPMVLVGDYVQPFIRKNSDDLDLPFMGVNREKQIVPTSANTEIIDRRKYSVLKRGEFVFSGMQTGRDVCIRIALSEMLTDILLSPAYMTFRIDSTKPLLPEYFFMNFKVAEMDRQGWFKSDSSVRSNLDWDRFCEIEIPLPPIEVQRAIVALYHCAEEARKIAAEARLQLTQVCPAMIQRASHCR